MARILVVDDNDLVRTSVRMILESAGHEVSESGDGRAALETVRAAAPDLVLTDLVMPGTQGADLIAELRGKGFGGVIIAMSGGGGASGPTELLGRARALGADACVPKPFH